MRWTLITVTHNSESVLERFWRDIVLPSDVEWIVVDNCSQDGSVDLATALGANTLSLTCNRGFSAANNIGLRQARGTYLAFVNPDVTLDPDSLPLLESDIDGFGCLVAPQLCYQDGSAQPNGRGLPFLDWKILGRLTPKRTPQYLLLPREPGRFAIAWAIGAAICGRAETFRRLGGWDDRFFLYYEDADLCLRALQHGTPTMLDNRISWVHGWARETTAFRVRPWVHELRSALRFYARYPHLLCSLISGRRWCAIRMSTGRRSDV